MYILFLKVYIIYERTLIAEHNIILNLGPKILSSLR